MTESWMLLPLSIQRSCANESVVVFAILLICVKAASYRLDVDVVAEPLLF